MGLILFVVVLRHGFRTPRAFRDIGTNGVILALALGLGFACYVWSVLLTTIASVTFIISAGPLFTAMLGLFVLRERVSLITWLMIAGATIGMALIFFDSLEGGRIVGTIIAMGLPVSFAIMIVMIRRAGDIDMLPATCLAGLVSSILGLIITDSIAITLHDFLVTLILGVGQLGLGFGMITLGTRYVPAAESALLSLSESILAPIWAWLFLAEIPTSFALGGGLLVLTCVGLQGIIGILREHL